MRSDLFWLSCRHEIDRLFDAMVHAAWGGRPAATAWTPPADVVEEPDRYRLEIDLPGVRSEDLSITAEGGALRIEGRRPRIRRHPAERNHLSERPEGRFVRSFRLPANADAAGIRARLRDGVLVVEIPKHGR